MNIWIFFLLESCDNRNSFTTKNIKIKLLHTEKKIGNLI